ncbi:hypothetical protein FJ651_06190 [Paucihalobacter ruber]|uniref:Uncharacterized protein n=1 Tax=Paucihalobacter ruber TaxID=2567861 RepID=A0A506PNK6_9FLAO|nr:hypothetical protein [Paucihalobacter ruber]TPV35108.1 hypothetical protein FJ651_06190 [Paucihalobacter ruber]
MRTIKSTLLFILAISMSSYLMSQELNFEINSPTIYDETIDLGIGSSFTKNGMILTWVQEVSGQTHTNQLEIISSAGNWDVDSSTGNLIYNLVQEGSGITLTIIGQTDGITAELTMPSSDPEAPTLVYTFTECIISYL